MTIFRGTNVDDKLRGTPEGDTMLGLKGFDVLRSFGGSDTLDGGPDGDHMYGGSENDSYRVDNPHDVVYEKPDEGDTDWIFSTISFDLRESRNVENLTLVGGVIHGVGNALDNQIEGTNFSNRLQGARGDDILLGKDGNDELIGGEDLDYFVFDTAPNTSTNVDRILEFSVPDDMILLDNKVMDGLGTTLGTLAAEKFWKSTAGVAHDADDRIIYDTDSGRLSYDANGNAAGGAVHFASLAPVVPLALTNANFEVI